MGEQKPASRRGEAMTGAGRRPLRIFIGHAAEDSASCQALEGHLRPLEREGTISVWSERRIAPGTDRLRERREQLEAADVVLVLVSRFYLASDQHEIDLQRARDAQRARVVPILVRPFDWKHGPLGKLLPLPRNEVPIEQWPNQDAAWAEIVQELKALLSPTPPPADEPRARLWVHGWAKRDHGAPPTVEIDWTDRFAKEGLRIPPPQQWPALLAELQAAEQAIANLSGGGSFVDVRGLMPLSVALAVGWALPHVKHYRLRVEQFTGGKSVLWDSRAEPSARQLAIVHQEALPDGEDLALALSITEDVKPLFDRFAAKRVTPFRAVAILAPDGGPGPRAVGGERDAVAFAESAKQHLRSLRHAHGLPARTHLFLASPAGLALFLGHTLNALGEVLSYERASGDTYQPAVTLPTG